MQKKIKVEFKHISQLQDAVHCLLHVFIANTKQNIKLREQVMQHACEQLAISVPDSSIDLSSMPDITRFMSAIKTIDKAYALVKGQILNTLAEAASFDNDIEPMEQYIIQALAARFAVPMPNRLIASMHAAAVA
ncbi:MAG: hypothetical protein HRU21_11005 [Pseudomonadales bacterium]|nr:hypothetical protein [Pseudomonadales bacterium]